MIGLYAITNTVTNKSYVGSSCNIKSRFSSHKAALNNGYHHNSYLLRAWKKYGTAAFKFKILKICQTEGEATELEQAFLQCFYGDALYNLKNEALGVGSGRSHPNKGKALTTEHKQKISRTMKGMKQKQHTADDIKKISQNRSRYIVTTPEGVFYGFANAGKFYGISEVAAKKRCKISKFQWIYENK